MSNPKHRVPNQRWEIFPEHSELALELSQANNLHPLVGQILVNRGITNITESQGYLQPETLNLPSPLTEFGTDLEISLELLEEAIANQQKIAICGDYDADGMTSTALLIRCLRSLNANVDYAIPSRMKDGYGINNRIIEEFYQEGVKLILTVDNGISAHEPIEKARDLEMDVIITDHHDLPRELPVANAILNPKLLSESSPYHSLAGVGVAYILAVSLAQKLGKLKGLTSQLLELFTLGTIADLAPLTGVNRRWLKRGLQLLPHSELAGVKALIQLSGVEQGKNGQTKAMKPESIGFRLGPRINAIGRIGDPQIVIDLLTTNDDGLALERSMQCEQINKDRQSLCEQIEKDAIQYCEEKNIDFVKEKVLVLVQKKWHHGVIGIVASRLVERYGVPVFIATYEEENPEKIRGSARGIREFHVFEALDYCAELLGKFGGHKAAGGFSLKAENWDKFHQKLIDFANEFLKPEHIKPLLEVDVKANLEQINIDLYKQIDYLQPCGIENAEPIFYTANVRIIEQQNVGKNSLKLTVGETINHQTTTFKAIAWRSAEYLPLPKVLDIAYKLKENQWNGEKNLELEIVGFRLPEKTAQQMTKTAEFNYKERVYSATLWEEGEELIITNPEGKILTINLKEQTAMMRTIDTEGQNIDLKHPFFANLMNTALQTLE
jgi:single-stranded-DNA-specific exonuclease